MPFSRPCSSEALERPSVRHLEQQKETILAYGVVPDHIVTHRNLISKIGLIRLIETLNIEYKDTNIRFFAIHPASVNNTKQAIPLKSLHLSSWRNAQRRNKNVDAFLPSVEG